MPLNYSAANLDELVLNVIYGYYVKYDNLIPLINNTFSGSNATSIDIYIDMRDILLKVDKYIKSSQLPITNPLVFISGIINMIAHYRNFFATRYRCTSRFWIIDSVDNVVAKQYYAGFSTPPPTSPTTLSIYNAAVEFLPMICQYINNVQYERSTVDVVTKVLSICKKENDGSIPSIIITKDPFALQACMIPGMYILKPKKNKYGDVSILVDRTFASAVYLDSISGTKQFCLIPEIEHLSLLMAMTRVPSRSLKTMFNIPNALQKLSTAYSNGLSRSSYPWDLDTFIEYILFKTGKQSKYDPFELKCRFQACDTVYIQGGAYDIMLESKLYKGIVNLYDPDGIKKINNEYFKSCPLDLNVL